MNEKTKISKTILSILCLALVAIFARAGESVTNWVDNPAIRTVNGQIHNVYDEGWGQVSGAYQRTEQGGVILRRWIIKRVPLPPLDGPGGGTHQEKSIDLAGTISTKEVSRRQEPSLKIKDRTTGKMVANPSARVRIEKTPGSLVHIANYPSHGLIAGAEVNCLAKGIGKMRIGNQTLDAYDYGVPAQVPVVTTSK